MDKLTIRINAFFAGEVNRVVILAILGLGLRFIHLGADLWEKHSWREADVAMISSNFFRNGFDILHPQINWAGNMPGYVGTEFPLVSLLTALLYLLFGEQLILGRLVSVGFFALSIPLFYLLVRRNFGQQCGWWALFFYVVSPLSVFYTRNLMPESPMLCFSIGSLYFFSSWLDSGKRQEFLLAILFTTFALLVKIPMGVMAVPLGYLAFKTHNWSVFRQRKLWLFGTLVTIPSILWYQHAFSLAANNYPFHVFGAGLWIWDGGYEALFQLRVYLKIVVQAGLLVLTPVGLLMAAGGVIVLIQKKIDRYLFHWWTLGLLLYVMIGLKGHFRHEYYQLPFVPVAAAFAGVFADYMLTVIAESRCALRTFYKTIAGAVAFAVLIISFTLLTTKYHSQPEKVLYDAGISVKANTPTNALIVAWDGHNPTLIYASNRHGWHFAESKNAQESLAQLEALRAKGATYFVAPLRPRLDEENRSLIRTIEAVIRRKVLGLNEADAEKYLGGLRLFEPESDVGVYLMKRYHKSFEDQFVSIYDLSRNRRTH